MQGVKEKAIQLLKDQTVDRIIGWRAGEFFYDLTPSVFTSVEDIEKNFVWSVFSGANLSKYLIAESRKGGKAAVFLKPCDSYSFVQLLKEHRILRESVYAVGVQCGGMCDMEAIKEQGLAGVTAVTEDGEALCVSTIYGEETIKKADVLLLKCKTCKGKDFEIFDEIIDDEESKQPTAIMDRMEDAVAGRGKRGLRPVRRGSKARSHDSRGALRVLARRAVALYPLQRVPQRVSRVLVRKVRVRQPRFRL